MPKVIPEPVVLEESDLPVLKDSPSLHKVVEYLENSQVLGVKRYVAVGAKVHAGWKNDDMVSKEQFLEAIKSYSNQKVQ